MTLSHERLEELLRAQAARAYLLPPDLPARIHARLEGAAGRPLPRAFLWSRPLALAAAALLLLGLGTWFAWPADGSAPEPMLVAGDRPSSLASRLASVTGLRGLEHLAQSTEQLLASELESPIRSELAALASDARRTADGLFAQLARPVGRLVSTRRSE